MKLKSFMRNMNIKNILSRGNGFTACDKRSFSLECFMKKFFSAFVLFLSFSLPSFAEGLGRFVGVLEHKNLKKEQLAKLDFIASRENGNQLELTAVLTLHFGDFKSQEYVAFHFDKVRYNILTKTLVFDQVDQDATVIVDSFSGDQLVGRFRSVLGGEVGTLRLEKEGTVVSPKLPLIEPVWGEYKGSCDGKDTTLQIYTSRSSDDVSKTSNPFATYRVKAFRATREPNCFFSGEGDCVNGVYDAGEFNFYKNQLVLYGRPRPMNCTPDSQGLTCDKCNFKRVSGETTGPRQFTPITHEEKILGNIKAEPALTAPANTIQGEYFGYVHHEYLDRYQPVSVNLVTFQEASEGGTNLKMSAVATLYFGKPGGTESISYRFDIRNYPNPIGTMQFVFSRPEADIDPVLQVTALGKGEMKGTWFSQLFGRVGKFALQQGNYPTLPAGAKVVESILGVYESSTWDLDLYMRPEETGKTPANSENPFFPRSFDGGFIDKSGATPRIRITGGSYDFYTGRIALEMDGRIAIGQRDSQKRMAFRWANTPFLAALLPFELEPFRYVGEP